MQGVDRGRDLTQEQSERQLILFKILVSLFEKPTSFFIAIT